MEIEIPDAFIVSSCSECNTCHAPIRDCPIDEEI